MIITEFAPAKINLALHVLGRRVDGYHELDSVVAFASIGDVLEIEAADNTVVVVDGPFASGVPVTAENLVLKAHAALAQHAAIPPVSIRLTKNLPVASGIGGGSADAAAALRGLMRLVGVRFDAETMQKIALSLGADLPVCLHGQACRMQGVGEVITPLERLPAKAVLLVNPMQACSTADVFRAMALKAGDQFGTALEVSKPETWRNDMTAAAIAALPVIDVVLAGLRNVAPNNPVRMSGSGATCFALFSEFDQAETAARRLAVMQPGWWVATAHLT